MPNIEKTDGCWLWTGSRTSDGYGGIRVCGKSVGAHRVAYELFVAPIPDGLHVLHRCDTPNCVRPEHLFLGTHADNMSDMATKGRANPITGERHHSAKLTVDMVREVRRLHGAGVSIHELARRLPVRRKSVQKLLRGKSWKSVT